jgi:hypothetical protein
VTLPSDPLEALKWALNHTDAGWWAIGLIGAGIAWSTKRMREWSRRNALVTGPAATTAAPVAAATPAAMTAATYTAAPSYAAAGYTAQPAYAAPPPAPLSQHGKARKHREAAAVPQRVVAPVARSIDVPVQTATGSWTLAGAFGDAAHARTAIVIAEVLGPPVGLR